MGAGTRVFDANMHAALRRWHECGGDTKDPATAETPFHLLLMKEDEEEGLDGEPGEYEWMQRILGVRLVFRWVMAEGFHPLKMMKRLFAVGRALRLEPFCRMSMTEQGRMFNEGRANVQWRMKVLSGEIKLQGMRSYRLPGQKTERASEAARRAAMGNCNRRKGKGRRRRKKD